MTAWWRDLAFFNYELEPTLLTARVPPGTELDLWHGRALVSLIGLRFLNLRVRGFPVPGHMGFEQINLRFYVKQPLGNGDWRRGVVFIKEMVPKALIVPLARLMFGEPYLRRPTRHTAEPADGGRGFQVRYEWKEQNSWHGMTGRGTGQPSVFAPGSVEEFVTERYSGYNYHRSRGTAEFRTQHPPWLLWPLHDAHLTGNAADIVAPELAAHLRRPPHSAFMAQGSAVAVFPPRALPDGDLPHAAA
jgi:uncharacterized protein YqjF (DUF2071 family)